MESDSVRGDDMNLFDIAVAKKLSGGSGGGGSIHYTIEGTVANIMSQTNYSAFANALFNGTAFARLTATLGTDTATLTLVSNQGERVQASVQFLATETTITSITTYIAEWNINGALDIFEQITNASDKTWKSTNYKPMATQVPCTLEIVLLD